MTCKSVYQIFINATIVAMPCDTELLLIIELHCEPGERYKREALKLTLQLKYIVRQERQERHMREAKTHIAIHSLDEVALLLTERLLMTLEGLGAVGQVGGCIH